MIIPDYNNERGALLLAMNDSENARRLLNILRRKVIFLREHRARFKLRRLHSSKLPSFGERAVSGKFAAGVRRRVRACSR